MKEITQLSKTCSINKGIGLLSFAVMLIFLTLKSFFFFLAGSFYHFVIYVSFENEVVEAYIHKSSLTVTLLSSQGFCLCYKVTLDLTRVSVSTRL